MEATKLEYLAESPIDEAKAILTKNGKHLPQLFVLDRQDDATLAVIGDEDVPLLPAAQYLIKTRNGVCFSAASDHFLAEIGREPPSAGGEQT